MLNGCNSNVRIIIEMSSPSEIYKKLEKYKLNLSLVEIIELNVTCKAVLEQSIKDTKYLNPSSTIKIQAIIDYTYEQVNIGNWKEVKPFLRKTITLATYLRLLGLLKCSDLEREAVIKEAYKIIDFGILFGCPLDCNPNLLQDCASYLNSIHSPKISIHESSDCSYKGIENIHTEKYNVTFIETVECPSMENFYKDYIQMEKPVVLTNCINHWPALSKWQDQSYFIKLAGLRTVSIELGRNYTDSDWTQKLMTIEEFIKNYIYKSQGTTGYLAQYQLFEQIPELKEDIIEPEYCCFSDTDNPIDVMAWYGPKGTISPLHHDPKKNLLAQVIGEKQIFLFSPSDSEYLYPHEHELLNNTARVDPREPDLEKYPNFKKAKGYYCVLQPGQILYIPPKWWHFVESLSISFSVSFWWE